MGVNEVSACRGSRFLLRAGVLLLSRSLDPRQGVPFLPASVYVFLLPCPCPWLWWSSSIFPVSAGEARCLPPPMRCPPHGYFLFLSFPQFSPLAAAAG